MEKQELTKAVTSNGDMVFSQPVKPVTSNGDALIIF